MSFLDDHLDFQMWDEDDDYVDDQPKLCYYCGTEIYIVSGFNSWYPVEYDANKDTYIRHKCLEYDFEGF